jgi:general secretion pathway protein D
VLQQKSAFLSTILILLVLFFGPLACGGSPLIDSTSWTDRLTLRQGQTKPALQPSDADTAAIDGDASLAPAISPGSDFLLGAGPPDLPASVKQDEESVTLNLVKVPLAEAAKTILGEILGLNYSIDDRINAEITLQTTKPITKSQLVANFQAILRTHGVAIVERSGFYRIIPMSEIPKAGVGYGIPGNPRTLPAVKTELIPLRFVSAEAIREILEPIALEGSIGKADTSRNALFVTGTREELDSIRETVAVFDVDWMKSMSFALYPVKTSSPEAIAEELRTIFATEDGPLKGVLRFVPNTRLKSILVITSRSRYLKEASAWIARLDRAAGRTEAQLHVYHVQNRPASELAEILQSIFDPTEKTSSALQNTVAPKLEPVLVESQAPEISSSAPAAKEDASPVTSFQANDQLRIVADDANNSLLIVATAAEYERILLMLQEIDSLPNQVMLEATIAEITLGDELNFGMRWYFGDNNNRGTFTDVLTGAVASSFPGFSYFFNGVADVGVVLNALSSLTKVHVLSSPTLMVLDNRTATLQVGDQVPVITQSANSVNSAGAPVVNTVELKDTGVILAVTPRVNDSGRVTLEIKQEVSDVVATTTSGIDSPTIRQRKVTTTVAVNDGDTLALGGLIQERDSTSKTRVPLFADIPILGTAFRSKSNTIERTELVIFIRPRVTRDVSEARHITREFRKKMQFEQPSSRSEKTQMERDAKRITQ